MTVRAEVPQNTWGHIDYAGLATPVVSALRKAAPYLLVFALVSSAVLFAVSCKSSTVAFMNEETVASLNVEVVDTPEAWARGLMNREKLAPDSGMLFDFGRTTQAGFWMKDTTIPLSIAFVDSSGKIVAIRDLEPLDLTLVSSPSPYRYAIEVNRGWFDRNGVKEGSRVTIDV